MDDDSAVKKSKMKEETTNKVKDGYIQLAEKMEQVRSQMAKMERKYDELYQTVKERESMRNASVSAESEKKDPPTPDKLSIPSEEPQSAQPSPKNDTQEEPVEETKPKPPEIDLEKMEDNPFV